MPQNSKMAWKTTKKPNSDKETDQQHITTLYQVAGQLLVSGEPLNKEHNYMKKMKEMTHP